MIRRRLFRSWIRWTLAIGVVLAYWLLATIPAGNAQSRWQIEVVDDGGGHDVGMYSALAVDRNGAYHIAYYDATKKALRYAFRRRQDKQWSRMSVDEDVGPFVSLAADAQARPHMAYNSASGLRYAYWDNDRWHIQIIDRVSTQFLTSLRLDDFGNPHLTYFESYRSHLDKDSSQRLKYAYSDGTTWYKQTIEQQSKQEPYDSLALDSSGIPYIAYAESERLKYAYKKGSQWIFDPVDIPVHDHVRSGLSIALDAENNPSIAYLDVTKKSLNYVSRKDGIWKAEVVEELSDQPSSLVGLSLKIDTRDQPHIAYDDKGVGGLKYAAREDGKWVKDIVVRQEADTYPSLSLDSHDQPFISYTDLANRQLRFARLLTSGSDKARTPEIKQTSGDIRSRGR